jgi:hypothetical protein
VLRPENPLENKLELLNTKRIQVSARRGGGRARQADAEVYAIDPCQRAFPTGRAAKGTKPRAKSSRYYRHQAQFVSWYAADAEPPIDAST